MRLRNSNWARGTRHFFQQHEVAEPRTRRLSESALTVGRPKVCGAAQCLLGSIIVIVAKRGTRLRLELDRSREMTFNDYKKIPLLRWPEEARQLNVLPAEDRSIRNPTLNKQIAHQLDESVKLRAAGNGTPAPLI